ncbi:hypothetical protein AZO1586I_216 [Bathymodiolus thermophilus thioautotrophic gill symbiont]|uniref:Uncharacterized protein n=1 Tax=Bathymodiolus thermophilus thioautotrophic gill symbiont TaxID=2360 RepID=A0ABM8M5U0_9GAMM|nr:hypothetical protein AZO1586I_216 [Bathymodiolus thermophilus thioautotrophic gill symbiont]
MCCKFLLKLTPITNRFTEMLNAGVLIGQKLDFAKLMVKLQKQKHYSKHYSKHCPRHYPKHEQTG